MSNESKENLEANEISIKSSGLLAFIAGIQKNHSSRVWLEIDDDGSGSIRTYSCCDDKVLIEFQNIEQLTELIKG